MKHRKFIKTLKQYCMQGKVGCCYNLAANYQADVALDQRILLHEFNNCRRCKSWSKAFYSASLHREFSQAWREWHCDAIAEIVERMSRIALQENRQFLLCYHNAVLCQSWEPKQGSLL